MSEESVSQWFDERLPHGLADADIAGAIVAVVQGGEPILLRGYGFADIERELGMDPRRSVVSVASVTKLVTWAAVMREVQQGRIDLDADLNTYLEFELPRQFDASITMRHLMTHTAGFAEHWARRAPPSGPRGLREYLLKTPPPVQIHRPGTIVAYSNYGVLLAAYVVERTSGVNFSDYLQDRLLDPMGMDRSAFAWPIPASVAGHVVSYYEVASGGVPAAPMIFEPQPHPAGSLFATGEDMAALMASYLEPAEVPLDKASVEKMYVSPALPPGAAGRALGFWRYDRNKRLVIEHTGDGDIGEHAIMTLLPEEGVGLFMAFNSHGRTEGLIPAAILLRSRLRDAFLDRFFPDVSDKGPEPEEAPKGVDPAHAEMVAGEYRMARRSANNFLAARDALVHALALKIRIRALGGGDIETAPFMTFADEPQRWRQIRPFVWRAIGGYEELSARVASGRVLSVTLSNHAYWGYEPVSRHLSPRVNLGLLASAAGFMLLATLAWPVQFFRRRRGRGGDGPHPWRGAPARFLTRIGMVVGVVFLAGWLIAFATDIPGSPRPTLWLRALQGIGLVLVAASVASFVDLCLAFANGRGLLSQALALLSFLSLAVLVWFSLAFHLISIELRY